MADHPQRRRPKRRKTLLWLVAGVVVVSLIAAVVAIARPGSEFAGSIRPASSYELPLVVGAVPYWDEEEARRSIETHSNSLDVSSPWSYAVTGSGSVELQPDLDAAGERALADRLQAVGLQVIPTIANTTNGLWDPKTVSLVIGDTARRQNHVQAVVSLVTTERFDGIQIDYEDLTADDRDSFSAFVTELAESLHAVGKVLYVTVHVKEDEAGYDARNRSQDYAAIGKAADRVCLMAYDWHWSTGPSGPIAPYDWVDRVLRYSVTQIPPEKILLGVGLFGYDWVGSAATNLTWRQVVALAATNRADEAWDVGAQSPHFTYTVEGVKHDVWYENGRSAQAKFDLAVRYRLGGVELWRLGGEDPAVWDPGP